MSLETIKSTLEATKGEAEAFLQQGTWTYDATFVESAQQIVTLTDNWLKKIKAAQAATFTGTESEE